MRRQSMQKCQGISILFFSRQSKARPRQAVIAKWQTKQWCKKGKISARQRSKKQVQRSVPWVSRVEGLTLCEAPRYRFKKILKERLAALDAFDHMLQAAARGVDNKTRRFPNPSRGTPSVPACTQYGCSRPWSTVTARGEERCTRPASVLHGSHDASEGTTSMQAFVQPSRSQRESRSNTGKARLRGRQPG